MPVLGTPWTAPRPAWDSRVLGCCPEPHATSFSAPFPTPSQGLRERDARDEARAVAPLRPAPEAVRLDTSALSAPQALEAAREAVLRALPQLGEHDPSR